MCYSPFEAGYFLADIYFPNREWSCQEKSVAKVNNGHNQLHETSSSDSTPLWAKVKWNAVAA
jgi:hypothetical protein